ncbi:hypothetical protein PYW07_006500 [Mythimna separata]|uniref:Uncharacterized protein n=1 Tax=Mythimna separata TaxID=271217 RepID=A0AAD7YVY1_MYTSE|nr:hypothetical protein PYW07_006500 [Mythimna separata]
MVDLDLQKPVDQVSSQTYPDNLDRNDLFGDSFIQVIPEPVSPVQKDDCPIPEQPVFRTPLKIIDPQITPETVRPFEKAGPRKGAQRGKKPGRTRILTDTPENDEILGEALKKAEKKEITGQKTDKKKKMQKLLKKHVPPKVFHNLIHPKLKLVAPKVI